MSRLDRIFGLTASGTTARTELLAGLTTFLTMAYIVFVQPAVLSGAAFGMDTGMDLGAVTVATCLSSALASALMGLYARYPIALAPGMGLNFFFVFSILPAVAAAGHAAPWRVALGVVFVAGLIFLALSLLRVRERVLGAISASLRNGIAVGIGLFIAFIGLRNGGLILTDPGTAVRLTGNFVSPDVLVFFLGLFVAAGLMVRGVRGALLWGILAGCALAVGLRLAMPHLPAAIREADGVAGSMLMTRFELARAVVSAPPSIAPTFLQMDLAGAVTTAMVPLVVMVLFIDVFDTLGTLVGVGEQAGFLRDGRLPRANRAFLSDAVASVAGAALGTSTVTSYIESAAGVEAGGRTGLTAVATGALFLLALFFSPLIGMVGSYPSITAPALVLVGGMMMANVVRIDWGDKSEAIPAFLTLIGIPLTYSIADGIALGLVSYPIVKLLGRRGGEVPWFLRGLAVLLILHFVFVRARLG